jgi:hypothetical protein
MSVLKSVVVVAAVAAGFLASPPAAAQPQRVPEPKWCLPRPQAVPGTASRLCKRCQARRCAASQTPGG